MRFDEFSIATSASAKSSCIAQPGLPVVTIFAPVAITFVALRLPSWADISLSVREYVPADPQHIPGSLNSTNFRPGIDFRIVRGAFVIR